jgi:trehalose 6-phosphate synthase/phosphatase
VDSSSQDAVYSYRYGIFRGGIFYRWEQFTDSNAIADESVGHLPGVTPASEEIHHRLPLRLLSEGELYLVSDVLGQMSTSPDIEHIHTRKKDMMAEVSSLISSRDNTFSSGKSSHSNLGMLASIGQSAKDERSKKKVAFAPAPPRIHPHESSISMRKTPVYLESSDGLIVVSAFLPVHLNRTETGQWTADWDYESLLSMQTHLRVTRVGVVKWRGWHGNKGSNGSPEGGVPESERSKVEECLKVFNCVPVWVEPAQFGQM